jgi:hypothetical protein
MKLVLLVLILKTVSCRDEANVENSLAGRWEWVNTEGGFANHIHDTPVSKRKRVEVEFTNANTYRVLINGAETSKGTYRLTPKKCIHDHKDKPMIIFSSPSEQDMMIELINKNILRLSDEQYDGVQSNYRREKFIFK